MEILVTGSSGFLGSHMVDVLLDKGHEVIGLDIRRTTEKRRFIHGNICNNHTLGMILRARPEVIIHLAAETRGDAISRDPAKAYLTNSVGTLKLLEAARKIRKLRSFIHVSSDQAYGVAEYLPIDEKHPLRPYNLYGVSKASGDLTAQTYSQLLPLVIVRPGTVYGPRSAPNQVVTKFFLRAMQGVPILFDTRIDREPALCPTRDYNFVQDTIKGLIQVMEKRPSPGSVYNIASGHEVSVLDLARMITKLAGGEVQFSDRYVERPTELSRRLVLDITKAKNELGYAPKTPLAEGLKMTYEWLLRNPRYFG